MGSRDRSIRFKIFLLLLLPLLSLSALWGFVLNLTVGDGEALSRSDTLHTTIGVASSNLVHELQAERTQSAIEISSRELTTGLGAQRERTDQAVKSFLEVTLAPETTEVMNTQTRTALQAVEDDLRRLDDIRDSMDDGKSSRLDMLVDYNRIHDALFRLTDQLVVVPDLAIFQQVGALQSMNNAREIISREKALISGVLVDQQMLPTEHDAFTEYVSTRTFLHARGMSGLDGELGRPYQDTLNSPTFKEFIELEQKISAISGTGALPSDSELWPATIDNVLRTLDELSTSSAEVISHRSDDVAGGIVTRITLAGGLGFLAVVASILISVRFGRRLARELAGLQKSAVELADVRLPALVERLRSGEEVDIETEAPPITAGGSSEIADVAAAFSSVQRTAVEAAVGQANLRRGIGQVFLNLARRKQALLHRQLGLLDGMQRRTHTPDGLEDLFRLDHLTTRMRRNAEGLIILSGAAPGRAWRQPVPVIDVLRAALAEVEDYTRINIAPMPRIAFDGAVVADTIHLIAELIENATIYSPPKSPVDVRGDTVANGFAIEVEDRGLGLALEAYEAINARLADPPEFDLADSDRLGLFVVGRLAARHGIRVMLRSSPYGGTVAIVLIPRPLVTDVAEPEPEDEPEVTELTARRRPALAGASSPSGPGKIALPGADSPREATPKTSRRGGASLAIVNGDRAAPNGTHAGLPRRVRQANLAPQLRQSTETHAPSAGTTGPVETSGEPTPERSPDEVRALFSAFQQGARRGREAADYAHNTTREKGEE
ncbi:HAMP domain-containing protein [Sinosporangium album]|uniref:histidine kinase n=1 Tax=Sinosporangium album TaxID=504805 RepID=A0A1G8GWR9_9ACTN|nr:nitrate- and nitrite sensing domain-containing protein [Sinosporangium album]SDH98817.1 HAMP domain-containing protein [Sinosporangium album]